MDFEISSAVGADNIDRVKMLVEIGEEQLEADQYSDSANTFSVALNLLEALFGPMSDKLVECYVAYAKALIGIGDGEKEGTYVPSSAVFYVPFGYPVACEY